LHSTDGNKTLSRPEKDRKGERERERWKGAQRTRLNHSFSTPFHRHFPLGLPPSTHRPYHTTQLSPLKEKRQKKEGRKRLTTDRLRQQPPLPFIMKTRI
jgi:hypothetical protein